MEVTPGDPPAIGDICDTAAGDEDSLLDLQETPSSTSSPCAYRAGWGQDADLDITSYAAESGGGPYRGNDRCHVVLKWSLLLLIATNRMASNGVSFTLRLPG